MEIKIPEVGESIFEAQVGTWHKQEGEQVAKDDLLCELETDKISLELNAEVDGILHIAVQSGETVKIGTVIGSIEERAGAAPPASAKAPAAPEKPAAKETPRRVAAEPGEEPDKAAPPPAAKAPAPSRAPEPALAPVAPPGRPVTPAPTEDQRTTRQPLTPIRKRIAERLLAARQQTAMLTTFNEADLTRVMALRRKHGEEFRARHGVKLGFMSFFVKAATEALKAFPEVNARLDEDAIVYQHFYDIGIAIGAEKGLVVPVLRDADQMHFADVEQAIAAFADKVAGNKLALADLEGGTFTISNGGVYGSLLSTPILNPPQSAVLGMHAVQDRPVVRDGAIVIRPMMYLALSYDHRIIDGRQAVTFLKRIVELVEEPEEMLLEL